MDTIPDPEKHVSIPNILFACLMNNIILQIGFLTYLEGLRSVYYKEALYLRSLSLAAAGGR